MPDEIKVDASKFDKILGRMLTAKPLTIMKLCQDMPDFNHKFAKVFKKASPQLAFDWMD
jgi:lipid A disaccharide synthetase